MEDKLTGDFFGNLRYLPYKKGTRLLLDNIKIYKAHKSIKQIMNCDKYSKKIKY